MLNLPKSEPVRLGFLVPERNVTCEVEFPCHLPVGVTAHFSRLPRKGAVMSADSLLEMMESVDVQSELLTKINVRVIMAACTSGSFLGGTNAADELGVRIKRVTGIPGISTSTAVVDALRAMDVRRFFMITPYPHDITRAEVEFFEEFGFDVTGTDTFACTHAPMIPALTSSQVVDMADAHAPKIADADALFISCTNLATMDQIAEMEERHGKPVITSNSATLWRALRAAELPPEDMGVGTLFRRELLVG